MAGWLLIQMFKCLRGRSTVGRWLRFPSVGSTRRVLSDLVLGAREFSIDGASRNFNAWTADVDVEMKECW